MKASRKHAMICDYFSLLCYIELTGCGSVKTFLAKIKKIQEKISGDRTECRRMWFFIIVRIRLKCVHFGKKTAFINKNCIDIYKSGRIKYNYCC